MPRMPDPVRSRIGARLGWPLAVAGEALLIVLLLPFGFVFTGTLAFHQAQLVVIGLAGAAGWLAILWRPTRLASVLVLAPIPLLAAMVASALTSPYPSLSWPATWQTTAYAGLFFLLALQASHPVGRRNLLAVIGIVVILALTSFLVPVVAAWLDWLRMGFPLSSLPLRPSNTGGLALIPTWLGDLVVLGAPVLAAYAWVRGARVPAAVLVAITLGALVVTGTRSILLFVAAIAAGTVVLSLRGRARSRLATGLAAAVLGVGVVLMVVVFGSARSLDEGRLSAYASALARFRESPFVGTGPGTYGVERMRDPVDVLGHVAFPDAHNIILTTLAETGIVGLAGLLATVGLLVLAVRPSLLERDARRLVITGALFGVLVFAAHGMVDVVFGLVGIIIVAIAVVALAVTDETPRKTVTVRPAYLRAGAGFVAVVALIMTGLIVRQEGTLALVADADAALLSAPADALALARRATDTAPDLVPAWWVQMLAADAAGDSKAAIAATHRVIALEGFGQQWITLAVLASRAGDQPTELDAIARATAGPPIDPLVELNVIALRNDVGDEAGAEVAARRLLDVQPDIERIVRTGPIQLATPIASIRADAALSRLANGDPSTAMLIALSGEDRALAGALVTQIGQADGNAATWQTVVDAWFGDQAARLALGETAISAPTLDGALWAWRLSGHACDEAGMSFWERALQIGYNLDPSTPSELVQAGKRQADDLPPFYPTFVWRLDHPQHPYVAGTWTFFTGRPACAGAGS